MKNYYVIPCFVSAAAVLAAGGAFAQQCTQAPSCAELGFTDSVSDCADDGILYCPFDKSKVFCRKVNTIPETPNTETQCKELGYMLINGVDPDTGAPLKLACFVGKVLELCPYNSLYGKCVAGDGSACEDLGFTKNPTCPAGQGKIYCIYDNSYAKCTGLTTDGCTVGFINTPENCNSCPNGIKPNGYKSSSGEVCYSCCEASPSGMAACISCLTQWQPTIDSELMK